MVIGEEKVATHSDWLYIHGRETRGLESKWRSMYNAGLNAHCYNLLGVSGIVLKWVYFAGTHMCKWAK